MRWINEPQVVLSLAQQTATDFLSLSSLFVQSASLYLVDLTSH
jgi:hypothetical protein